MKIQLLKVKNFRGFAEQTIFNLNDPSVSGERVFRFSDQFNILVGDNGTGKTAILDALAVGAGSLFLGFDGIDARSIRPDEIHRARFHIGQTVTIEPQYPVVVRCEGIVDGQPVRWTRTLEQSHGRTTRQHAAAIAEISRVLQERVRRGETVTLPLISYYGTGRLWLQKKASALDPAEPGSRMLGYIDCLDPASNEKMLLRWLKRMELIALQKQTPIDVLDAVKQAVTDSVEQWRSIAFDISQNELVATADDGRMLPFRMLSDGVRNMLAMVADMAYRAAVLNPHLGREAAAQTPGIVLIDEIDLHLHPKWQRQVVEDLRRTFPAIQFIATTHSPFIIQSLRPGELINLDSEEPNSYADKSIEDIAEQVMDVPVPQRSERWQEMMAAAKEYYRVLQEAKGAESPQLDRLKARLDDLAAPFSDNVAYHAFLQMEREAAGIGPSADQNGVVSDR